MKKINNYSAQFKTIQKPMNTNENQFDEKIIEKIIQKIIKKRNYQNKTKIL